MKKKILIIVFTFVIFIFGVFFDKLLFNNSDIDDGINEPSPVNHKHMLSMMLETDSGSGVYTLEERSWWPTKEDGYIFNSILSKCEKESQLRWDDENNAIIMVGTTSDKCYVYFDKVLTLSNYVKSLYTGTQGENNLYYHTSSLENGAGDNSYRYSGGNYKLTDKALNDGYSNIYSDGVISLDSLVEHYCDGTRREMFEYCSTGTTSSRYYILNYDKNKNEYGSFYDAIMQAYSDGYIEYDVSNYVCFGSDASTCSNDNLYRIIGVFENRTKLIKADFATSTTLGTNTDDFGDYLNAFSYYQFGDAGKLSFAGYYWNKTNYDISYNATGYYNDWSYSELNLTHLNINYINYLDNINTKWVQMIDTTEWKVGGIDTSDVIPSILYTNEIMDTSTQVIDTYVSQVGLMYLSDYGFAAEPSSWDTVLCSYDSSSIMSTNWMYMGLCEWTITRSSSDSKYAHVISENGSSSTGLMNSWLGAFTVRPVFYLNSDVEYDTGTGTKTDPIRIKLD